MSDASPERGRQFDLLAFAKAMKAQGRHRRLVDIIEKATSVCSAHEDLRAALENLTALREITRGSEERDELREWAPACAHALTAHSIVLYCRATQTSSNNRRSWFGLELLDDNQRELHRAVKRLRDDAIAHFGIGEAHPEGPLVREALILTFEGTRPRPIFHTAWSLNRAKFTFDFLLLVEAVRTIAAEKARERMNEVLVEVAKTGSEDRSLGLLIEKYRFEPDAFFITPGAQEHIWERFGDDGVVTFVTATAAPFYEREE
jgi:hypothetical protein